eukprot:scaffold51047_cov27-Tisochrysis_lutea.AAC.1
MHTQCTPSDVHVEDKQCVQKHKTAKKVCREHSHNPGRARGLDAAIQEHSSFETASFGAMHHSNNTSYSRSDRQNGSRSLTIIETASFIISTHHNCRQSHSSSATTAHHHRRRPHLWCNTAPLGVQIISNHT